MTVPFKAIDKILDGLSRIDGDCAAILATSGPMPIAQLLNFRDSLDAGNDFLLATFRTLLALYAADPDAPTAEERQAANAGITAYINGRVPPPSPANAVQLFAGIRTQIIAVMNEIEASGDAKLNGINGGVERTLGAGGRYQNLTVTKAQRANLDTALTALRGTLATLFG